jgi:hypothetical protein
MNVRPSRVPSPSHETTHAEPHADASFTEVERGGQRYDNIPARTEQHRGVSERVEPPQPALPQTGFAKLAGAIAAVMAEIKPVEKEGWNDFQKYRYAKMQDLSRELTPLMGKHGIVIFQTEEGREMFDDGKAVAVRYRFTIVHSSGEIWPERPLQTGLSRCRDSKGGFDDKTLNKCHTSARKYFLLSLFQIPTADEEDADAGGEPTNGTARPRPQSARRPVPSPSGKVPPHFIEIIPDEQPQAWAARFAAVVAKASSEEEINLWYNANVAVFDKLKSRHPQVYNDAVDHMDACVAKLNAPPPAPAKPDPISSGPAQTTGQQPTADFPGDTPMPSKKRSEPIFDIPINLDARLTDNDREWLLSLVGAYAACTDTEQLASEQESIMLPAKESASDYAWARAVEITKEHLERIQAA